MAVSLDFISVDQLCARSISLMTEFYSWVYSDKAPKNEATGHTQYVMPADYESKPCVQDGYGIGSLIARNILEDVTIGGVKQNMPIDAATSVSWPSPFDGILGMSFSNGNVAPSSFVNITTPLDGQFTCGNAAGPQPVRWTFMEKLVQGNTLDQPVFALNLKYDTGGTVQIGGTDRGAYQGDLSKVNAERNSGWWVVSGIKFKATGDKAFTVLFGGFTATRRLTFQLYADRIVSQTREPQILPCPPPSSTPTTRVCQAAKVVHKTAGPYLATPSCPISPFPPQQELTAYLVARC